MRRGDMNEKFQLGLVLNIQRFTVHDGPGIRTEIFLKGCPLRCTWCSNPESQVIHPEVGVHADKCIGCGLCQTVCQRGAHKVKEGFVVGIDYDLCCYCMDCVKECPTGTLKGYGEWKSVESVMKIIEADRAYYHNSSGGVTVSGGDPLVQWEFTGELLRRCKKKRIHTCVESELYCRRYVLDEILPYTDLIISDIKHIDPEIHEMFTGVKNMLILENIKYVVDSNVPVILRIPIVPGYNDEETNIRGTAKFIQEELGNRIVQLQLLPFKPMGEDKYLSLGKVFPMEKQKQIDAKVYMPENRRIADIFREYGVPVENGADNLKMSMINRRKR